MGYNLYTDKANKFNCNIEIEGTSLAKSKVRLVIETDEMSYMFNGSIENTGVCEVNIPKTKNNKKTVHPNKWKRAIPNSVGNDSKQVWNHFQN